MTMRTSFSPELLNEMANAYELSKELLGATVKHDEIAQHIVNVAAFGVNNAKEMTLLTVKYTRFKNNLIGKG